MIKGTQSVPYVSDLPSDDARCVRTDFQTLASALGLQNIAAMLGVDILCVFPLSGVTARGLNAPAEAMYTDLQRVGEEFIKSVEKLVGVLVRVSCRSHHPCI